MRDIYSERVILFALAMEGPSTWVGRGEMSPSDWASQAVIVQQRYDIPRGIVEQQAFRVHPEAYQALAA